MVRSESPGGLTVLKIGLNWTWVQSEIMEKYAFQTYIQFAQNARKIGKALCEWTPLKTHCLPIWSVEANRLL